MWKYLFYRFGQFIIFSLSRERAYRFSRFLSDLQFHMSFRDRNAVIRNLRQITGKDENLHQQAREVFRNFGRYLVDFFLMATVDKKFVEGHVTINGRENLKKAMDQRKGVIILTAHIGNWEMGAVVLGSMGHRMTAIALPHKERSVNDLFNKQREKHGVTVVPTNLAIRKCIEALKRGELIALLGDRDFGAFGEPLMFLGRRTLIPKGAAFFSFKTGAPIIPSFFLPTPDGRYEIHFKEPIFPPAKGREKDEAVLDLTRQYATVIEDMIRRHPTQWLMFRQFGIDYENLYTYPRA